VLASDVILMTSPDVTPGYCSVMKSWNSGPNFGALETAQQSKRIPRAIRPVNQAFPLLDHFYCMGGQNSEGEFSFVYFSRINRI
jgi:hypothetical protein